MTDDLATTDDDLVIPKEIVEQFLELYADNPGIGHVRTLRQLGMTEKRGPLRGAINRQLKPVMNQMLDHAIVKSLAERGITGVYEDVWYRGEIVGQKLVYDTTALLGLAQVRKLLGKNQVEITGAEGGPVVLAHEQRLTLADVAALASQIDGPGTSTRGELPAARPLLAAPDNG